MAKIEGIDKVKAALEAKLKQYAGKPSVVVGYTQNYALWVHENLVAHHPVGNAKFLEIPLRQFRSEIAEDIVEAVKRGAPLGKALLIGGLRLQRESQKQCPVDTGALRLSAFTELEKGETTGG